MATTITTSSYFPPALEKMGVSLRSEELLKFDRKSIKAWEYSKIFKKVPDFGPGKAEYVELAQTIYKDGALLKETWVILEGGGEFSIPSPFKALYTVPVEKGHCLTIPPKCGYTIEPDEKVHLVVLRILSKV